MNKELIIYFLVGMISYINLIVIYGYFTKQSFLKNKKFFMFLFLGTAIITILYKYNLNGIKAVYTLVFFLAFSLIIYKNNFNYIFFYVFTIWVLGMVLDIIFISLFSLLIYLLKVKNSIYIMFLATIVLQFFYNRLARIERIQNFIAKIYKKVDKIKKISWLYLLLFFSIVILAITAFINFEKINIEMLTFSICMLIILFCVFYIHFRYKSKIYDETVRLLLENNLFYLNLNNQNREFKHNIIHRLNGIKTVANSESIKLIGDMIKEYNLSSLPNKELDNLPNGINGLIYQKINENKNKKLNLAVENNLKTNLFDLLVPRNYNRLCEVLGVCLDNSISASLKSKEKVLHIGINEDNNFIYLRIVNTFSSELEIDKLGTKDYSTKKNGHGIGLQSILVKKEVVVKTFIINNLFENKIFIKKKKV